MITRSLYRYVGRVFVCPHWVEVHGTDQDKAFLEQNAPREDVPEGVVDRSILELINDDAFPLSMVDTDGHTIEVDRLCDDPYPPADYPSKTNKERRFFFYRSIALLLLELAGWGQSNANVRVRLPQPVYDYISDRWGESTTGFKDPYAGTESQATTVAPDDSENSSQQASPPPPARPARTPMSSPRPQHIS